MKYDSTQPKKSQRDCIKIIEERGLKFGITRVGQSYFLFDTADEKSVWKNPRTGLMVYSKPAKGRPIVSWTRCWQWLSEQPYEKKEENAEEKKSES